MAKKDFNNTVKPVAGELIAAVSSWNIAELKSLLARGVDVNERSHGTMTALMLASDSGYEEAVQVLIENGADLSAQDRFGNTALILAAVSEQYTVVEMLIDAAAQLDIESENNITALKMAQIHGAKEIAEKIERGIKNQTERAAREAAREQAAAEQIRQKIIAQVADPSLKRPLRVKPIVQIK